MDLVVDFLSVTGPDEDIVVTELSVVGAGVLQTYHFDLPTDPYDSPPPVRDGDTGHIPYSALPAILQDAVAGYAHLYSYGRIKCGFLSALVRRTFVDLAEFRCPASHELTNNQAQFSCARPCHRFSSRECAARNAHSFYRWLTHHLYTMSMVTCPTTPDSALPSAEGPA